MPLVGKAVGRTEVGLLEGATVGFRVGKVGITVGVVELGEVVGAKNINTCRVDPETVWKYIFYTDRGSI